MKKNEETFSLQVGATDGHCPIGELVGQKNCRGQKIPVFSCEGACIRGEIARRAANLVGKNDPYRRGCHGELLTVPRSAIATWTLSAEKVVLIDGCFLRCHGRILENLIDSEKLIQFDALSRYGKYNDIFDMDAVPESEIQEVAIDVASWVIRALQGHEDGFPESPRTPPCQKCCG